MEEWRSRASGLPAGSVACSPRPGLAIMLPLLLVTAVQASSPDWWSGVEWGEKLVAEQAITSAQPRAQSQAGRTVGRRRGQKGGIFIGEEERGRGGGEGRKGGPEERSLAKNKVTPTQT